MDSCLWVRFLGIMAFSYMAGVFAGKQSGSEMADLIGAIIFCIIAVAVSWYAEDHIKKEIINQYKFDKSRGIL